MPDAAALLFFRIDPARNMARFYGLSIEPSLFGDVALVRRWGRIGTCGRQLIEFFPDLPAAHQAMAAHMRARLRRGYRRA